MRKPTLSNIKLTNNEWGLAQDLLLFLSFMRQESAPVPDTADEADAIITKYVLMVRRANMERLGIKPRKRT
jgi:hypothetical protein